MRMLPRSADTNVSGIAKESTQAAAPHRSAPLAPPSGSDGIPGTRRLPFTDMAAKNRQHAESENRRPSRA